MDIIVHDAGKFFFPQREKLKLFDEKYSPDLLQKITYAGGHSCSSFENARENLKRLAEVDISVSHIQRLTIRIASEFDHQDCECSAQWDKELSEESDKDQMQVVCISVDGGRVQTREENAGAGVHNPAWMETKVACFQVLKSSQHDIDPHPQLPTLFQDKNSVKTIVEGLNGNGTKKGEERGKLPQGKDSQSRCGYPEKKEQKDSVTPEVIKQYVHADIGTAESFGHALYHKANQFHLAAAPRKAYLGDGDTKIWSIFEENFKADNWIPILDFIHAIEHAFEAAKVSTKNDTLCWALYLEFATHIWQGRVLTVLRRLDKTIAELEKNSNHTIDKNTQDKIDTLKSIRTYFKNNLARMNYPFYRKMGFPICSCHIESLIKQFNIRIKSSEKFWNKSSVKGIIKMKASLLSHDDSYQQFWNKRFDNQSRSKRHYYKSELKPAA